jgi:mannose-1-phosphate guanylyltransferase
MAGGSGSRLWPLSRQLNPKQFLPLAGDRTLFQATLNRLEGLTDVPPLVLCNEEHRFIAAEQLRQIGVDPATLLLEPVGRNTAPAIALAALQATADGADPLLLVLAADHVIQDTAAFHESLRAALPLAESGRLVTFGVVPTAAETGYGYIQRGDTLGGHGYEVARFVEKPDPATAQRYLEGGEYYWNSGMFLFRASDYLEALEQHQAEMLAACRAAVTAGERETDFLRVDAEAFTACPAESIDYAVMEKADHAAMVTLDAGWSDIGSWSALWDIGARDDDDNVLKGDVVAHDTRGTLVQADHRLVAAVGVEDLVVVETKDAVLVSPRQRVQEVKKVVERLQAEGRHEHLNHREVYRPWGCYDSIDNGDRFQVKRITVKPGAKLSVQMHHHRAEHWVVVRGTARVTNGEESFLVTENQSTYIPIGRVHALENPGSIPLELVEVQSGSYLGEDDIVRFDDQYGRV